MKIIMVLMLRSMQSWYDSLPSWLMHQSDRHLEDYDRWTISFNALPTGKVNIGPWDEPMAYMDLTK